MNLNRSLFVAKDAHSKITRNHPNYIGHFSKSRNNSVLSIAIRPENFRKNSVLDVQGRFRTFIALFGQDFS